MSNNIWQQLENLSIHRSNWKTCGVDGFYEHERRTRVITKRKEVKGFAEFTAIYNKQKELVSDTLKEHKNSKYGVFGKEEFETTAKKPENRARFNEENRKIKYKKRYVR